MAIYIRTRIIICILLAFILLHARAHSMHVCLRQYVRTCVDDAHAVSTTTYGPAAATKQISISRRHGGGWCNPR